MGDSPNDMTARALVQMVTCFTMLEESCSQPICKLMPDTEGSSQFRIPRFARDSKAKITRGRGLTGLDQHKMSAKPD